MSTTTAIPSISPSWLKDAIFYQIYPQSFYDTNGDGIGDIAGIVDKLDYIQALGCNVIWLNPCFDSPFGDGGYDISDFYRVAPRYGTNADLKRLFVEAHRRGMRVVLDLVAGHTSIEHAWFKESSKPAPNEFSNRYIWTDNVWRGPGEGLDGIRGFSDRDGQYVTNFFHFQPALNYGFANPDPAQPWQLPVDHPDVVATRRALLDILLYWIGEGADGFRVDMAMSLVKNDPASTATMSLWREIRAVVEREFPEAVLISEWSVPNKAIKAGFHLDFMIHFGTPAYTELFRSECNRDVFGMAPNYGYSYFDAENRGDISQFLDVFLRQREETRALGFISVPTGNHDISRISLGRTTGELKVAFTLLFALPIVPCIYYGDEIGMRHLEALPSKEGGYRRTGARSPMQWADGRNAGFSEADPENLYLPVDIAPDRPTVAGQDADTASLLNHVRSLARLRKRLPALSPSGEIRPLIVGKGYPFVFLRTLGNEQCLVVLNPGSRPIESTADWDFGPALFTLEIGAGVIIASGGKHLRILAEGFSFGIFSLKPVAAEKISSDTANE